MTQFLFTPPPQSLTMQSLLEPYQQEYKMQNPREQRQQTWNELMSMSRLYMYLARRWTHSDKYTIDEKLEMVRAADALADECREQARRLVVS